MNNGLSRLESVKNTAVEQMRDFVLNNIEYDFLKYANDLNTCNHIDINIMISIASFDKYFDVDDILNDNNTFSVTEYVNSLHKSNYIDVIDELIENNWEDVLDNDIVVTLYDYFEVHGIINKDYLNGGEWESFEDFKTSINNSVIEHIVKQYN